MGTYYVGDRNLPYAPLPGFVEVEHEPLHMSTITLASLASMLNRYEKMKKDDQLAAIGAVLTHIGEDMLKRSAQLMKR